MNTVLIAGASRGIGLELARQYAEDGWRVIATCRSEEGEAALRKIGRDIRIEQLDMRDFDAVARFGERLGDVELDLLIANAGISGPRGGADAIDARGWLDTLAVNSVAPTLLAGALAGRMASGGKLVAISSQMGSIADNGSGGSIAYRSSKAALNAAWKSLAIDLKGRGLMVAVLHPGWVQTAMGGSSAPITPRESVSGMRRVIDELSETGAFLNYRGERLPW